MKIAPRKNNEEATARYDVALSTVEKLQRRAWLSNKGFDPDGQLQLDMAFPEVLRKRSDLRHIPNDYGRSSLFTARSKSVPRETLEHHLLFHYDSEVQIYYTGIELRAEDDELIWLQLMSYAQSVPLGTPVTFDLKDLVVDIGWQRNGSYYDKARRCISRLKANEVLVLNKKAYGKSGAISLIKSYEATNDARGKPTRFTIVIDPAIMHLFAGNRFTSHVWDVYRNLSPVARRLADYVCSHRDPYPLSLDNLRGICGSSDKSMSSWRQTVRKACAEIEGTPVAKKAMLQDNMICCVRH